MTHAGQQVRPPPCPSHLEVEKAELKAETGSCGKKTNASVRKVTPVVLFMRHRKIKGRGSGEGQGLRVHGSTVSVKSHVTSSRLMILRHCDVWLL